MVGCLGTDSVCRNMETLLAKANALEEEGITAYCYTGSYDIPVKTLTGSIKKDVILIEKINMINGLYILKLMILFHF